MEKLPFFLYRKRERSKYLCKRNPEKEHYSWLILPFLVNLMAKVNIFSFSGIFQNFTILQAIFQKY
jgi:hypothetical protein